MTTLTTDALQLRRFMVHLHHKLPNMIGFIPEPALEPRIERGHVIPAFENDDLCGFLLRGPWKHTTKIYQTAVQFDAQRRTHGLNAVEILESQAIAAGVEKISLHCAADLEANEFWAAAGFQRVGQRTKSQRTKRLQYRWEKILPAGARILAQLDQQKPKPSTARLLNMFEMTEQHRKHQLRQLRG